MLGCEFPDHGAIILGNVNPHTPVYDPLFVIEAVDETATVKLIEVVIVVF
jgi:hypothetical protein